MSGQYGTGPSPATIPLGQQLRTLREAAQKLVREVAAAVKMDAGLLSKIETGKRPPTKDQLIGIAKYFKTPIAPLEGRRLVEEFLRKHAGNPALAYASAILREEEAAYSVNKLGTKASKPAPPVDNRKKMK